jgi:hypothetical protein
MTTFNWQIVQMDRITSDGFVFTVHYNVGAIEGIYQSSTYGTTSYTPSETYMPYEDLTQEIVVGWVQATLGKDAVEANLQSQIDALKAPVQESGVPWATA